MQMLSIIILILVSVSLSYSLYYLFAFIFSIKTYESESDTVNAENDNVAILMTICNDFTKEAAASLMKQDYNNFQIFLLDDSYEADEKHKVDEWAIINSTKVSVIRRNSNKGYKAGNINYSLKKIPDKFNLLCIVDSDQFLPYNYISNIVNELNSNESITFIQGIHKGIYEAVSPFSKTLSTTILPEWRYHLPYKNNHGHPIILGHGYLIRRERLLEVGGLPEIVSEDLALSMKLGLKGYKGIMSTSCLSQEIYPESFKSIQSRRFRWTLADWEILFKSYFRNFLSSSSISKKSKLDVFIREIRLPFASLYFTLIALITLFLIILEIPVHYNHTLNYIFLISMSPVYPLFWVNEYGLNKKISGFLSTVFVGFSLINIKIGALFSYLIYRKAFFYVTNSRSKDRSQTSKLIGPNGYILKAIDIISLAIIGIYFVFFKDVFVLCIGFSVLIRWLTNLKVCRTLENNIPVFGFLLIVSLLVQILFGGGLTIIGFLIIISLPLIIV